MSDAFGLSRRSVTEQSALCRTAQQLFPFSGRRADAYGWFLRGPLLRPDEQRFIEPTTLSGVRLRDEFAERRAPTQIHPAIHHRMRGIPLNMNATPGRAALSRS